MLWQNRDYRRNIWRHRRGQSGTIRLLFNVGSSGEQCQRRWLKALVVVVAVMMVATEGWQTNYAVQQMLNVLKHEWAFSRLSSFVYVVWLNLFLLPSFFMSTEYFLSDCDSLATSVAIHSKCILSLSFSPMPPLPSRFSLYYNVRHIHLEPGIRFDNNDSGERRYQCM